jgi:hypothetical protein
VAYRYWRGPVVGLGVTQVWQGIAARVWISFGRLKSDGSVLPNGALSRPHGELELTNVLSLSEWKLLLGRRVLATSDSPLRVRDRRLQLLVGRLLRSVQVDAESQATILRFTREVLLTTQPLPHYPECRPHWLLRLSRKNYVPVILKGTVSRWRGKTGKDLVFG